MTRSTLDMKLKIILNALLALHIYVGGSNGERQSALFGQIDIKTHGDIEFEIDVQNYLIQDQPLDLEARRNNIWRTTIFGQMHTKAQGDCEIDVRNDFVQNQPLYLVPRTNHFWRTTIFGQMHIKSGAEIEFYCPDGFANPFSGKTNVFATCVNRKMFAVDGSNKQFEEFVCKPANVNAPKFSAIVTGTCAGGQLLQAGYPDSNRFIATMQICFDPVKEQTLYVHYKIENDKYQNARRDSLFYTAGFFSGKNLTELFLITKQKEAFGKILGSSEVDKYINQGFALSKGHLAAKADFVFDTQQRTTFLFVNVAPQWLKFNNENWNLFEKSVQELSRLKSTQLECFTGTFGVITLPDNNGTYREIYLFEEGELKQIPVPKLYFRAVLEPLIAGKTERKGVVIVGVNNPFLTPKKLKQEYILCPDVIGQIGWLDKSLIKKMRNIKAGYLYACKVEDFIQKVTFLPELNVKGLLI